MKTSVAQKWNDQAQNYSEMASSKTSDAYEYEINFPSILKLSPGFAQNVLDLGSGNGVFTNMLSQKFENVTGSDVSPNMVKIAQEQFPKINFKLVDLEEKFPAFEDKFDLIVIKLVLMFVEDLDNVAQQCYENLNPGGFVIISVHHPLHHYVSYLLDKYGINENEAYRTMEHGYFSEVAVTKTIGNNQDLKFAFIHRTIASYINTFTKRGLLVDAVDEPQLTPEFLSRFPNFLNKKDMPSRLNIRFKKV